MSSQSYGTAKEILDYIEVNYDYNNFDNLHRTKFLKCKAEVELHSKNIVKANEYIENVIKFEEVNGESIFCSQIWIISGMIKLAQGKYSEAREALKYACKLAEKYNLTYDYCTALLELVKLMYNLGQSSIAIEHLEEIIIKASNASLNGIIKNASNMLYEHYKANKQYELALNNLQLFRKADKEIHSYKNMKLLAKMNIDHGEKELRLYDLLYDKTDILYTMGEKITSNLDIESLSLSIYSEINKLMKVEFFAIGCFDADKYELKTLSVRFGKLQQNDIININEDKTFSSHCLRNKKILVIDNIVNEYKRYVDKIDLEGRGVTLPLSGVYIPLFFNNKLIGNMIFQSLNEKVYDSSAIS